MTAEKKMKGRKRKPIPLKVVGADGRRSESALAIKNPAPPKHLGKIAAAKWRSIMPILSTFGTLTESDLTLVEMFCECYQTWREASLETRSKGLMLQAPSKDDGSSGGYYPSPFLHIVNKMIELSVKLTVELGLSPTARAKIMGAPRGTGKKIIRRVR